MIRQIPIESKMVQEGLFLYEYSKEVGGKTLFFAQLYCSDGYCFYDKNQPENYTEEGKLKPENELTYSEFAYIPYGMDLSSLVVVTKKGAYDVL